MKSTPPSAETHPNLYAWFYLVNRFNETVRVQWGAAAGAAKKEEKKPAAAAGAKQPEKKAEAKVETKAADDDLDLFGDDADDGGVSLLFNSNIMCFLGS